MRPTVRHMLWNVEDLLGILVNNQVTRWGFIVLGIAWGVYRNAHLCVENIPYCDALFTFVR